MLIDSSLKCWLIEINSSPSLAREHFIDDKVKQALVDDILSLVDPLPLDSQVMIELLEK